MRASMSVCVLVAALSFSVAAFGLEEFPVTFSSATYDGPFPALSSAQADCAARSNRKICGFHTVGQFVGATTFVSQAPFSSGEEAYWSHRCVQNFCGTHQHPYELSSNSYDYVQKRTPKPMDRDRQCEARVSGSDVNVDSRVVSRTIPVVGAPFKLNYFSNFQTGYRAKYYARIAVPEDITGNYPSVKIKLTDDTSAVVHEQTYSRPSTSVFEYLWNGKNSSGVFIIGQRKFTVDILNIDSSSVESPLFSYDLYLGSFNAVALGLGGWVPDIFAFYDVPSQTLYMGDGTSRTVEAIDIGGGWNRIPSADGKLIYDFLPAGRVSSIRAALTGTILYQFSYNGSGALIKITDAFSQETTFQRDGAGKLTSITVPNGKVTSTTINAGNKLTTLSSPGSAVHMMTYSTTTGLMLAFERPGSFESTFDYDSDGLLTEDGHSGGYFWTLANISADVGERRTNLSTPLGRITQVVTKDGFRKTVNPDGSESSFTYSDGAATHVDRGVATTVTYGNDPRWGATRREPTNITGHESGVSRSMDLGSSVTLGTPGFPFTVSTWTKTSTINSKTTTTEFDGPTMTWLTTTPEGRTASVKIDSYERPVEIQTGALTKFELTYTGDKLTQIERGARVTGLSYNVTTGFLESVTDALSQTTSFTYDDDGRVTSVQRPTVGTTYFSYGGDGHLQWIEPPDRTAHWFSFNGRELMTEYTPPALSGVPVVETVYTFGTDDKITKIERPDGQEILFTYSLAKGQLTQITTPAGASQLTYDSVTGQLTQIRSPDDLQVLRAYSGLLVDHEAVKFYSTGTTISTFDRTYDSEGLVDSDTVAAGSITRPISYVYDDDGLVTEAGDLTVAYDMDGLVSGTSIGVVTDEYTYNSFGEVTDYEAKVSGTTVYSYSLTRDDLGRVVSKTELLSGVTTTYDYDYDAGGRLIEVQKNSTLDAEYVYGDNGNRTDYTRNSVTISSSHDDQDRLVQDTAYDYAYNANGEMVSRTDSLTSQVTTYDFDAFGNLTDAAWPGGTAVSWGIDGLGRRTVHFFNGNPVRYVTYDPEGRIVGAIAASTGDLAKRFVYGSKRHVPDYYVDNLGVKVRMITDHLGSLRTLLRVSDGVAIGSMNHDEFGRATSDSASHIVVFGFAGGLYDFNAKLVYFGPRAYSPIEGRWLTKDPLGFKGGDVNLYGYAMNDPVNFRIDDKKSNETASIPSSLISALGIDAHLVTNPSTIAISGETKAPFCGDFKDERLFQ